MAPVKRGMFMRDALPVDELEPELRATAGTNRNFVLTAPTGSGKSTRVPAFLAAALADRPHPVVIVLQPRRMAARILAKRVAQEEETPLGHGVGYQIRHDKRVSEHTRILFVTEGVLLRRLQTDPKLEGVGAVLFDEFHERHLYGDVSLALLRHRQQTHRPDLILGVMSATLETTALEAFLAPCAVLRSEGRTFPIEIEFSKESDLGPRSEAWEAAVQAFRREAKRGISGNCLIFMPGAYEIRRTVDTLQSLPEARGFSVHALHGEQTPEQQDAAVGSGTEEQRIIVSTNVAETSLTLPGVRLVIDSGLARIPGYDARRALNTLLVENISRASADQRAGRAGRTAPGRCLRLWTRADHSRRPEHLAPEVHRLELAEILLQLAAVEKRLESQFPWFEAPPAEHIARGIELLEALGALAPNHELTPQGERMAAFPLHPRLSRMLLAAADRGCVSTICLLVALLEGRSILLPTRDKTVEERRDQLLFRGAVPPPSDHWAMLTAWHAVAAERFNPGWAADHGIHAAAARQAGTVAQQLVAIARRQGLPAEDVSADWVTLHQVLLTGFPDQVARRLNRQNFAVETSGGRRGEMDRFSLAREASLIVTTEIQERSRGSDVSVVLSQNAAIEESWLQALFPEDFSTRRRTEFDRTNKRVRGWEETAFRQLVIQRKEIEGVDEAMAAEAFAEEVLAGRIVLRNWNESVEQWIARVNCLARVCPDLGFVPFTDEDKRLVVEQLCLGATHHRDLKDRDVMAVLRDWLNPALVPLVDRYAPEKLELSNGNRARIRYEADGTAIASAPIQRLYDVRQRELAVADGRLRLKVELLAPNQRPVQLTEDLDAFWEGSYHAVKKDLKGRYPKHEWR